MCDIERTEFNSRINFDKKLSIIADIDEEFKSAVAKHPKFNSRHEGFAILKEEVDELWDEVKKNHTKTPEAKFKQRKEAVQIAAMAMRFIYDCCDEPNPEEKW